jgi:hypothetical protein
MLVHWMSRQGIYRRWALSGREVERFLSSRRELAHGVGGPGARRHCFGGRDTDPVQRGLTGRGRPATMSADRPRGFRGSGPTSPHAVHELLDRLQVLLYSALVLGLADLVATIDDRAVIAAPKMRADLDQG